MEPGSLGAPPYPKGSRLDKVILRGGLDKGDKAIDRYTTRELVNFSHVADHRHNMSIKRQTAKIPDEFLKEPSWLRPKEEVQSADYPDKCVHREQIRRGQQVFQKYYSSMVMSLMTALLQGFVIGRFSEVLVLAGYSKSSLATFTRFLHTAQAVHYWMTSDLFDPSSPARVRLFHVRCLHGLARKAASPTWEEERKKNGSKGSIGIPLSQHDMLLVQLAFGPICMDLISKQVGHHFSAQEIEDYFCTWRYIGYHLGIEDEFNACESYQIAQQYKEEFLDSVPWYSSKVKFGFHVSLSSSLFLSPCLSPYLSHTHSLS